MNSASRIGVVVLSGLLFGGCAGSSDGSASPNGLTSAQARTVRLTRMLPGERLLATRPSVPPGTKIYRPEMALIQTSGETTFVPKSDVVAVSGRSVTIRLNGTLRTINDATITYRNDISETYVKPGIEVPAELRGTTPHEVTR